MDGKLEERRELIRAEEKERMAKYWESEETTTQAEATTEVLPQANAPIATQKTSIVPMTLDDSDDELEIVAVNTNPKMNKTQILEKISTLTESQAQRLLKKIFENVPATGKLFQDEFTNTGKRKSSATDSDDNRKKTKETRSTLYEKLHNFLGANSVKNREPQILLNG